MREFMLALARSKASDDRDRVHGARHDNMDPEAEPSSYRRCVKCNHVRLLGVFALISDQDETNMRRDEVCQVCR